MQSENQQRFHRPLAAAILTLFLAAFAYQSFGYGATDYELVFVPAAQRFLRGETIFDWEFVYPPFAVLLGLPGAVFGEFGSRLFVWLTNAIGATALMIGAWNFTGGRLNWRSNWKEHGIAILGLSCSLSFVFEVLVNRQIDLIIAGLLLAGLAILRRNEWLAGLLVGLAAAMKGPPLLFALYFLTVRRFRAATALLLTFVAATLLPDVLVTPADRTPRGLTWLKRVAVPLAEADHVPGHWHAAPWANHSLSGWFYRLLNYELVRTETGQPDRPVMSPLTPSQTKVALLGAGALLVGLLLWSLRRNVWKFDSLGAGAVCCLMLLFSPMSSKPHFCVLVLPAWAVLRAAVEGKRRIGIGLVAIAGAILLTSAKDLVGPTVNSVALWYGAVPVGTLLLFFGCVALSLRERMAAV